MSNANIPAKFQHVVLLEHIANEPVVFPQVQTATLRGYHARSILTTMLQDCESIKYQLIDL